jgi:microcystin-dependent protein
MAQPYVGEIRMFAGNFAPAGWMFCDGTTLPISENETLFNLIGTTYGGDGEETFNLPDLRGRAPLHFGSNSGQTFQLAQAAGVESVTLTTQQIPSHTHPFIAANANADQTDATNNMTANTVTINLYANEAPNNNMNTGAVTPAGGSQPHENLQPFLVINFIISLFGIFPTQT